MPGDSQRDLQQERIERLEARLLELEAHQAIQNLKSRYGALVDDRYTRHGPRPDEQLAGLAEQIGALFTEDAVWDGGAGLGVCEGREAIVERMRKPTLHFSWHYFVKPRIEVSGETARATWDLLAPCTTTQGQAMWMSGVEDDEYRCVGGEWLHTRMKLRVVFLAPHDVGWAAPRRPYHAKT